MSERDRQERSERGGEEPGGDAEQLLQPVTSPLSHQETRAKPRSPVLSLAAPLPLNIMRILFSRKSETMETRGAPSCPLCT